MTSRVLVTGAALHTALGRDIDQVWSRMLRGETSVAPIPSHWDGSHRSRIWSPLPMISPTELGFSRQEAGMLDPVSQLAVDCSIRALAHSGFALTAQHDKRNSIAVAGLCHERCGVFIGTGVGGVRSLLTHHGAHLRDVARARHANDPSMMGTVPDDQRFTPFAVPMMMSNAPSAYTGIKLGLHGANVSFGLACAASTVALGHAFRALRCGELDVVIAGGAEYLDDGLGGVFRGFDAARALTRYAGPAEEANRPFDARRAGFLFSVGGACMLVLEREEHARARGANALGEIVGYAETFDAFSLMALAPGGKQVRRAMRMALDDAGIETSQVAYLNSHGTGTESNDPEEAAAILDVLGKRVVVNSTKSLLGHTMGASGAIEALVALLSLRDQRTHPSRGIDEPIAPLNFAITATDINGDYALSESFAFGGHNAVLALANASRSLH